MLFKQEEFMYGYHQQPLAEHNFLSKDQIRSIIKNAPTRGCARDYEYLQEQIAYMIRKGMLSGAFGHPWCLLNEALYFRVEQELPRHKFACYFSEYVPDNYLITGIGLVFDASFQSYGISRIY